MSWGINIWPISKYFRKSVENELNASENIPEDDCPSEGKGAERVDAKESNTPKKRLRSESPDVRRVDIEGLFREEEQTEDLFKNAKVIDIFGSMSFKGDQLTPVRTRLRKQYLKNTNLMNKELDLSQLLTEDEIDLLFSQLKPQELLIIAKIWPKFKKNIRNLFSRQTHLWLSANTSRDRFFPFEDCCHLCQNNTDFDEFCTQIVGKELLEVLQTFSDLMANFRFTSLKCLRLFRFTFDKMSDEWLAQMCPNLLHLDLTECHISSSVGLAKHHNKVQHLILTSTAINEKTFRSVIYRKEALKTICVNSTDITGKALTLLPESTERLDIRFCYKLEPQLMSDFFSKGLIRLKHLRIEAAFDDNSFALLCSSFAGLVDLQLCDTNKARLFTTEGLKQIGRLSKLRALKLGQNILFQPIPFIDIFVGCPLITSFALDGTDCYTAVEESDLCRMTHYWPLLQTLELRSIDCVGLKLFKSLAELKSLRELDLTECQSVDDNCVDTIRAFQRINCLVLDKCHRLTNRSLDSIVEKAKNTNEVLIASLFRCHSGLNYVLYGELPPNLRLTFSKVVSKKYYTFDGIRTKWGKTQDICHHFSAN